MTMTPAPSSDTAADSQERITAEIGEIGAAAALAASAVQPHIDCAPYRSSILRHPAKGLKHADPELIELWAPRFGHSDVDPLEADLTIQHSGEPQGERITVSGRVLDGDGRPALPYRGDSELVPPPHPDAIRLHGYVLDGLGQPVPDAHCSPTLGLTVPTSPGREGWKAAR